MIKVNLPKVDCPRTYKLSELVSPGTHRHSFFIGQCGYGRGLFYISYSSIILIGSDSWDAPDCPVIVEKWVDVEINVEGESK